VAEAAEITLLELAELAEAELEPLELEMLELQTLAAVEEAENTHKLQVLVDQA
jgi:ribosomal protein L29